MNFKSPALSIYEGRGKAFTYSYISVPLKWDELNN